MKKYRKYIVLAISLVFVIGLDLFTKVIFEGKNFSIIKGFIGILSCHNEGAAFSMLSGKQTFLIVVTSILLLGMVAVYYFSNPKNILLELSLSFIIGGAIGNLIDRIAFGYVRDFIHLEFVNFAIFNIADSFLTIGMIGLCVYVLFMDDEFLNFKKQDKTNEKAKKED
ncbi:MAG: signal peptidase II [Clostridia bacterium]|nr:signal peptidase II [Clostridia bacterium]